MQIVAHRGAPGSAPENTLPAFERAIQLGADAVEMDVRLTADRVPVVFHYIYLDGKTSLSGAVFAHRAEAICRAPLLPIFPKAPSFPEDSTQPASDTPVFIPTLADVLAALAGRIGLEIEIKGPEPESVPIIASLLQVYRSHWDSFEVTSYEPILLAEMRRLCPGLALDLLQPRSESWMQLDVVAHFAAQRARLAGARAVHLHPTQLSPQVVASIRRAGIEVHAWEVNDRATLELVAGLGIPRICTDELGAAWEFFR